MAITTVRPNGDYYVLNAVRTPAGTPLSNSLDNATPLTGEYVSFTNGAPVGQGEYIAHMAGETVSLTGKRVRAIRARVDMQNMSDPGKNVYATLLLRDPGTGPNKETPKDWVSSTQAASIINRAGRWNTTGPNGGQWGRVNLDRLTVRVATYLPPSGTRARIHGLYMDIDLKDQPTITPVSVAGTNTTRPTVSGTWTTTEGDSLARVRLKVFSAAQIAAAGFNAETSRAVYDSGDVASSVASLDVGVDLSLTGSYTAYMKAAYLLNGYPFWSLWGSAAVTLTGEPATTPGLTVTADSVLRRAILAYAGRVNLLPADDADFEGTAGNYTTGVGITSLARSTAQARHGVASLAITYNGTANPFTANDGNSAVGLIPVKRGQQFRISGFMRANATGRAQRLVMRWYNTTPAYNSQTDGTTATDVTTGWTAFPDVTGTAPVDGYLGVQIQMAATPAAGEIHYYDQIQVVPGSAAVAWSPGGLYPTSTARVDAWDRSTGLDNLARLELSACRDGIYKRSATDGLTTDPANTFQGADSMAWTPQATGSVLDFGWPFGAFDEEFALPGVGGMVAVVSFYAQTNTPGNYTLGVDAHDGVGGGVGTGQTTIAVTATRQRFSYGRTLQAGTVHCHPFLTNATGATGQTVWLSGFQWELRAAGSGVTPNEWAPGQGTAPDWQGVRGIGGVLFADTSQGYALSDFEIPPGIVRTYRASTDSYVAGLPTLLASTPTAAAMAAIWLAPTGTWILKDVYFPEHNAAVRVTGFGESIDPDVAVFRPSGAELPVAFWDSVGGENGSGTIAALGDNEWAKLRPLLRKGHAILLDLPEGGHRYYAITRAQWPRAGPLGRIQRAVQVDATEVAKPPDLPAYSGPGFTSGAGGVELAPNAGIIFGLGDQMHAEATQAIYTANTADPVIRAFTHWYNDRSQIGDWPGTSLGNGWGSGWIDPASTAFSDHFALGAIHANFWLADVDAYAVSPQFYNTDLAYVLSNIYFGHGPNRGEVYVLLYSELQNTYDDGQPRYAERIRMAYLNAISTIRGMTKPAGITVRIGLGMGGYTWIGQTPDLSFWEPCIAASDFTAVQHMQDSPNYLSGSADIKDYIERSVAQLGAYGIPVMIYQFELWGGGTTGDQAWTKFVNECLNNDAWMNARRADGLFYFGLMQEPNINNTANQPTFDNAVAAMKRHRATSTSFTQWRPDPALATTAPSIDASSPAAVRTGVQTARTTASFTPPAGSLVAAFALNNSAAGVQRTHTLTDSLGGTWIQRLVMGDNSGTDGPGVRSQVELWVRKQPATGAAMTVTDTLDVGEGGALIVKVLTNANVDDPLGDVASASGTGTAAGAAMTTIFPNSLVIGAVSEWNTLAVGTAGTGCTVSDGGAGPNITSYILRRTAATTSPSSAPLATTAPTTGTEWNLVAAEFRGV